jgi:ATP-dependent DNA helicase RecQ
MDARHFSEAPDGKGQADVLGTAVKKLFGLSYLFPYQRLVISNMLEAAEAAGIPVHWPETDGEDGGDGGGNDDDSGEADGGDFASEKSGFGRQIVILPTGAGKSLCFQLPAMLLSGITLVIYPILSLMADQERRLREKGFSPVILRGGQDEAERRAIWGKLASGESRFIIANPEVLLTPRVAEKLRDINIVHIVIDEAHCVSEWGESFRPSYLEIGKIIPETTPLVTAFTATASAPVLEKINAYLFGGRGAHRIIGNPDRSNIRYSAMGCILRDLAVRDLLIQNSRPAIVFCSSRPGTEKLARYLRGELGKEGGGSEVRFYHAGLERDEKTAVERWFFDNPNGILISTCAYGMGVDKADIRTVIHRDCPPSVEAYLQESGRAGRDGQQSRAILLWGPDDEVQLRRARNETERRRLGDLLAYARDNVSCRREALLRLLNYEGAGDIPELCCDVCEGQGQPYLREEKSVGGFIAANRRVYTVSEAARVLAAAENVHWSEEDAKQTLKEMVKMNKLRIMRNPLWKNRLTTPARVHRR